MIEGSPRDFKFELQHSAKLGGQLVANSRPTMALQPDRLGLAFN